MDDLKLLGEKKNEPIKYLETFDNPGTDTVIFETDELTALCPKTGQPDYYNLKIQYWPNKICIESKSLKLYLWSFRNEGHFIEELCKIIAFKVSETTDAKVTVTLKMKARGGITIEAERTLL